MLNYILKDWLLFKQMVGLQPRSSTLMKTVQVFGVDPSQLPFVEDHGFKVPKVLALLRKSLEEHKGLEEVGIFRLAGEFVSIIFHLFRACRK